MSEFKNSNSIRPKKSLGQNFLKDEKVLAKIIDAAYLSFKDNVLEIGPGMGVLTKELVKTAGSVIAVEKDRELVDYLNFKFQSANRRTNFKLISDDILKVNLPKLIEENNFFDYKLVANIPYYITGQILRLFLELRYKPRLMVLLVQKEVSERICAAAGQMSILAVSVQYYGRPEIVDVVPKEAFFPVPEVDSAILKITIDKDVRENSAKNFFRIVKVGFSSKRKTLANNLSSGFKKNKKDLEQILAKINLDKNVRAQELSLDDWMNLQKEFDWV